MRYPSKATSRPACGFGRVFALASAALLLAGCDGLLDVENPTNLLDDDLTNSQLEETLSNTAEGNLAGPLSFVRRYGTLLTDHYWHPSLTLQGLNLDRGYRDRENSVVESMYVDLAAGRWISDNMVERLQAMVSDPGSHRGIAESYFYGGLARQEMAQYFREVTYDAQAPITPAQALQDAVERFGQAAEVAGAAGDQSLRAGAYGAIARAYRALYYEPIALGQGSGDPSHFQQAEQAARQALDIDTDFLVEVPFATPGPSNQMYARGREHMTPWFAFRRDPVSGELDPRITHTEPQTQAGGDVIVRDMKFGPKGEAGVGGGGPLPLNRAAEAELIIAEARFIADDMAGTVEFINRVRARSDLPPFASSDPDAIWEQLMYERDTELWLEGRRWADMRFYDIIPECPGQHTAPTVEQCGNAFKWDDVNKQEGMARRLPVAVQEKGNNPNYPGGG